MPKRILPLLLMMAAFFPVLAQSNAAVDELLSQSKARADYAAYMALVAGGQLGDDATPDAAFALLKEKRWIGSSRSGADPIAMNEFCAVVMRSLALPGGLMYGFFPGPRYAYKELVFRGIVAAGGGPKRNLAGDEVLKILRLAKEFKGGAK